MVGELTDGHSPSNSEAAARQETEPLQRGGSRMDVRGGCAMKGDARRRRRNKRQHDNQSRLCIERQRQNREDKRKGIKATTSQQARDDRGGGNGNGDGDRKCRAPPSQDLTMTALVLTTEAVAALVADDADGGNSSIAIVSSIFLQRGAG